MIRIYVPSSYATGAWTQYSNTARDSAAWTADVPGTAYAMGDVCSADYRSDRNFVATTGLMGQRLCYSILPFIIRNEYPSPHTYIYDFGFSSIIKDPSAKNTGLDNSNNPTSGPSAQQFSSNNTLNAAYSNGKFSSFDDKTFGFRILGAAAPEVTTVWDLQNTYCWTDSAFAFQVNASGKFTVTPEILASAVDYCHFTGASSTDILVSKDNQSLGYYKPYLWKNSDRYGTNWMRRVGSFIYSQPDNGTLILERGAMFWGFFYFIVVDNSKITWDQVIASARYETNLVTTGSTSAENYYYPANPNDFGVQIHGAWTTSELGVGAAPPLRSRLMWYGSNISAREARVGWFAAGRRID